MKTTAAIAAAVLVLSGCTSENLQNLFSAQEAGSEIDQGYFGNSTFQNVQAQINAGNFTVNLNRRFNEEVNTMVTFPFNSTVLDDAARDVLRQQAAWIRQFPEVRFKVFGHTDLVGSTSYNRSLGLRRAQTVVQYLSSQGVDRSRLEAVVTFGETQPVIATESRERRNRRTVTEVSGVVEGHPGILNGRYAEVIFRDYVTSAQAPTGLQSTGASTLNEIGGN